jgi:glyoxylase-like metal-dependent hydrolase (beta-lactamase superfamily II)
MVLEDDHAIMLAGDTSYTQQLMLDEVLDGVAPNDQVYRQTSHRIHTYAQQMSTVYLPTHDPDSAQRLAARTTVAFPNTTTPS